ncbi:MAG: hypothetical protein JRM82_03790 [Nitrososphaerota archaeon]|nr:hypothetical protein [Nitrososphaerota archaeon]
MPSQRPEVMIIAPAKLASQLAPRLRRYFRVTIEEPADGQGKLELHYTEPDGTPRTSRMCVFAESESPRNVLDLFWLRYAGLKAFGINRYTATATDTDKERKEGR